MGSFRKGRWNKSPSETASLDACLGDNILNLLDPGERRQFRKGLWDLGLDQVRHQLDAGIYSAQKASVVRRWIADVESGATIVDELLNAADDLEALKPKFVKGGNMTGFFLQSDDQAAFERMYLGAQTLLKEALGNRNDYLRKIVALHLTGVVQMVGGPSLAAVTEMVEVIRGAAGQVGRRALRTYVSQNTESKTADYIDQVRIDGLRNVTTSKFDMTRLLQMCKELNSAQVNGNLITVAILVRAIMDHVPPVFGKQNFAQVASNHGPQSFKKSMEHLDKSMRNVSDSYLHTHIRSKESLPSPAQVDVIRDLDVLLAEVIRLA